MIRPTPRLFRHVESVEIISIATNNTAHTTGKLAATIEHEAVNAFFPGNTNFKRECRLLLRD